MKPSTQGVLLAAVGGYLDTLGFVMLSGLFINHVTGNIVLAVADPGWSSVPEIVMFPVFKRRFEELGVDHSDVKEAASGAAMITLRDPDNIQLDVFGGPVDPTIAAGRS